MVHSDSTDRSHIDEERYKAHLDHRKTPSAYRFLYEKCYKTTSCAAHTRIYRDEHPFNYELLSVY